MQPLIKADSQLLRLKHPPKWTHKCYLFSMNGQMDKVTLYVHLGAVFSCREKWWTLQNQRFAVERVGVVRKREKRRKDETAQKYRKLMWKVNVSFKSSSIIHTPAYAFFILFLLFPLCFRGNICPDHPKFTFQWQSRSTLCPTKHSWMQFVVHLRSGFCWDSVQKGGFHPPQTCYRVVVQNSNHMLLDADGLCIGWMLVVW